MKVYCRDCKYLERTSLYIEAPLEILKCLHPKGKTTVSDWFDTYEGYKFASDVNRANNCKRYEWGGA